MIDHIAIANKAIDTAVGISMSFIEAASTIELDMMIMIGVAIIFNMVPVPKRADKACLKKLNVPDNCNINRRQMDNKTISIKNDFRKS